MFSQYFLFLSLMSSAALKNFAFTMTANIVARKPVTGVNAPQWAGRRQTFPRKVGVECQHELELSH